VNDLLSDAIRNCVAEVTSCPCPSEPNPFTYRTSGPCVIVTAMPGSPVRASSTARNRSSSAQSTPRLPGPVTLGTPAPRTSAITQPTTATPNRRTTNPLCLHGAPRARDNWAHPPPAFDERTGAAAVHQDCRSLLATTCLSYRASRKHEGRHHRRAQQPQQLSPDTSATAGPGRRSDHTTARVCVTFP
jgi:hypothetical protein